MTAELTPELAERFARIALGHVRREYPNKPDHVLAGPLDARTPRELHPIFYGSYDWHSCVHSYWLLARLLRLFPESYSAPEIAALFDEQFVAAKVAAECDYLAQPSARGFKRPYGWAWLLKLAAELKSLPNQRWTEALSPLAEAFAQRFRDFLPLATYPVRVGTHFNTAFGLRMAADYAEATGDTNLAGLLRETGTRWYGGDADCPAWGEPSGDDFLSSALIEAECMRRLLPVCEFLPWFERFLPKLTERAPRTLFDPATVSDRSDGKIAHLDGLNLSRAWCWRSLASACRPRIHVARSFWMSRSAISSPACRIWQATTWASTGWPHLLCWRSKPEVLADAPAETELAGNGFSAGPTFLEQFGLRRSGSHPPAGFGAAVQR